jgi:hypothetical protein
MKHERCSPPRCCRHRLLPATGLHCIELTPPLEQQSQVVHRHDRYTQVEESSVAAAATLRTTVLYRVHTGDGEDSHVGGQTQTCWRCSDGPGLLVLEAEPDAARYRRNFWLLAEYRCNNEIARRDAIGPAPQECSEWRRSTQPN